MTPNNQIHATAMRASANAIELLDAVGTEVVFAYSNGRQVVLLVDCKPPFVTGSCIRRTPAGRGGYERVFAAQYHGVQIEWIEHEPASAEVAHG